VFNHNVETVPRLSRPSARRRATGAHRRSRAAPRPPVPAADEVRLDARLGETRDEVEAVMRDLRGAACDLLTIGQ